MLQNETNESKTSQIYCWCNV